MIWQMNPYSLTLATSAVVAGVISLFAWQRRTAPGAAALVALMLAQIVWALTYALHWAGAGEPTPFFWLDATYLGVVMVPAAFLAFTLQFTIST